MAGGPLVLARLHDRLLAATRSTVDWLVRGPASAQRPHDLCVLVGRALGFVRKRGHARAAWPWVQPHSTTRAQWYVALCWLVAHGSSLKLHLSHYNRAGAWVAQCRQPNPFDPLVRFYATNYTNYGTCSLIAA